jgi:tetraacyldisaccharide 4'-kinase
MRALEQAWWRQEEGWKARAVLLPLLLAEGGFRAAAALRGALYGWGVLRSERVAAPVVSVGNLAVGGAGKTPAVIAIGRRLARQGRQVAVLSRGYGARRGDARVVADGTRLLLDAAEGGDEPVLVARRLPGARVLCGPRRAEIARQALALGADALILDDGFQHRALARDLDVVVVDAQNPLGNGHCLPRGPAREPLAALRRAGLVWLSRVDQTDGGARGLDRLRELARKFTGRAPVESRHAPLEVLDGEMTRGFGLGSLSGRRVLLLSGLARPDGFRASARSLGAVVALERHFPDHHRFSDAEVEEAFAAAAAGGCDAVLTTEKDAVRLSPGQARRDRLRVLRIEAEIVAGAEGLDAALDEALRRHPTPAGVGG